MGKSKFLCCCALLLCPAGAEARRLVSLMPAYTEIIFELGAGGELVGVTNFCSWPSSAAAIEKAGDYLRPNVEKVYALKPDLVFAGAWAAASSSRQLAALGIKVAALPEEKSVGDIFATIRRIAGELGLRPRAEQLTRSLRALLPPATAQKPLKVYIEADTGGWTAGGKSFLSDAIRLAGGENIFSREKRAYFQASWEEVLLLDPAAVILLSGTKEEFLARPMAATLAAARTGLIITTLDRDAFSRPGPRIFGEIARLNGLLYGKK